MIRNSRRDGRRFLGAEGPQGVKKQSAAGPPFLVGPIDKNDMASTFPSTCTQIAHVQRLPTEATKFVRRAMNVVADALQKGIERAFAEEAPNKIVRRAIPPKTDELGLGVTQITQQISHQQQAIEETIRTWPVDSTTASNLGREKRRS